MKTPRRSTLFVACALAALLVQGCSRPLKPQASCNFVQNPERQRVSWKGRLPIKISLHNSVPTKAYDAIDRAVAEYKERVGHGKDIFEIVNRTAAGSIDGKQDGVSTIYWLDTWEANKPREQARTTIYWSGREIFEADMRINGGGFTYEYTDATSFSDLDLDSLVLHELGHVLGLAHNVTTGSVMNSTLDEGKDRRKLSDVDLNSLSCEY